MRPMQIVGRSAFFPAAEAVYAEAPCGGQRVGVVHPTNAAGHATHSCHHPTDEADAIRGTVGVLTARRSGVRRGSLRWTPRRRCPPYERGGARNAFVSPSHG